MTEDDTGGTMIQTEPDYGEPQFNYSSERIGDWIVAIETSVYEYWTWEAIRREATGNDVVVDWKLTSLGKGLTSYNAAKAHCISVLESLTPDGFLPKSYVSTEDASREVHRLENGRWVCLLDGAIGEHDFATAGLAAAAHELESYGDEG